ncbi:MAG: hypothetical protein R3D70_06030 [Rhizobiaceae bacterium]
MTTSVPASAPDKQTLTPTGLLAAESVAEDFIEYHEFSSEEGARLVCRAYLQLRAASAVLPSDEEVAREIAAACVDETQLGEDQFNLDRKKIAAILARHRAQGGQGNG